MSQIKWLRKSGCRLSKTLPSSMIYQRSVFARDYGIISHSNELKRLAHKTQVYSIPLNDHLRTRLTHSIECSQIGRQISRCFSHKAKNIGLINDSIFHSYANEIEELTAAACLSHDLGHPPFGHAGAEILKDFCNSVGETHIFDDNKQTIRMLLSPKLFSEESSAALVMSLFKKKLVSDNCYGSDLGNILALDKKLALNGNRHPISYFMESADDIAYLSADLEDFMNYFLAENNSALEAFESVIKPLKAYPFLDENYKETGRTLLSYFNQALENRNSEEVSNAIGGLIRIMISNAASAIGEIALSMENSIADAPAAFFNYIEENGYRDQKKIDSNLCFSKTIENKELGKVLYEIKKSTYSKHILKEKKIAQQNILASQVLHGISDALWSLTAKNFEQKNEFYILPKDVSKLLKEAHSGKENYTPHMVVMDFISGMTDRYAVSFWQELGSPSINKVARIA